MDTNDRDFKTFFAERLKARGYTLRKLSEISGIAQDHLERLAEGRYDELPPAPYLRGYLDRLGELLDFSPDQWWEHLKTAGAGRSSGPADALPTNRFAPRSISRYVWLVVITVIIIVYGIIRFPAIVGQPTLEVTAPAEALVTVHEPAFTVRGRLENGDQLSVNGVPVTVQKDGAWQEDLLLEPNMNAVVVRAKKFLGGEMVITRQVLYEPQTVTTDTTTSTPTSTTGQ